LFKNLFRSNSNQIFFLSRAIRKAIEKLSRRQEIHIKCYDPTQGLDNTRRLTGKHETASYKKFSSGTASRTVSIRIPRQVDEEQCGYLEDRRPAANCDPYAVTDILVKTICLDHTDNEN
jgi:glutamine synthetase